MSALIDFSKIPTPDIIETLSVADIVASMVADLQTALPDLAPLLKSDPTYKILEKVAYRELLLRARINKAYRAALLATSTGADLRNVVAAFGVEPKILSPGDPNAIPPVPPTYEDDDTLRARAQLQPEALSRAGTGGAYRALALSIPNVLDAAAEGQPAFTDGKVRIAILAGNTPDGHADAPTLAAVTAALNNDDIRALCDVLLIESAQIIPYTIDADIYIADGPDPAIVMSAALASAQTYAANARKLGNEIALSALYAALQVPGVRRVELNSPAARIQCAPNQAPYCDPATITLTNAGIDQ